MRATPANPMLPFGLLNCGVLDTLNASARNSTRRLSENLKFLNKERSTCFVPGPYRVFRPELPKTYWPGATKAEASNQRSMLRASEGSSPDAMRFGNCDPVPVFRLLVCIVGVKGSPLWNVPIVLSCHPPASHCHGPVGPAGPSLP